MNKKKILDQIAQHIRQTMADGFVLEPDTIHFIESSFSIKQISDVESLVDEGHEDELETILNLVVFPDHPAMCAVESFLVKENFDTNDEKKLAHAISEAGLKTRIRFPNDNQSVELDIPRDVMLRFILKLNITFNFPTIVKKIMEDRLSDSVIIPIRVLFRHSGWTWSDEFIEFLSLYFTYAAHEEKEMLDDLRWAIDALSGTVTGKSIKERLIHCYHDYEKRIAELETLEEMLRKNTMETLMLQGVRIPSITAETLQKRLATARRILSSVYAWVNVPGSAPASHDLGDFNGKDGMKKIMSLLS